VNKSGIGKEFRKETEDLIEQLQKSLAEAILGTDDRIALPPGSEAALADFYEPLPENGSGAAKTIDRLVELSVAAGGNTPGPRCFHFVIGGSTPAALAADLLATAYEQITYTWVLSPVGVQMEVQALNWLKEMLGLPTSWPGVMVTGATMANFVCLAAARQWWGEQLGVDVSATGLAGMPQMPVLTSGFVHASTLKVLATQGVGYGNVQEFRRDDFGRVDLEAMEKALVALDGQPAVMIVNAGEVNAGEFDPVSDMVELARRHNCWVHVDGAFGLFAKLSPRTAHFVEGVEKADSATVDGHKWLNVPYDSGYAFVRDYGLLARAFPSLKKTLRARHSAQSAPRVQDVPGVSRCGPRSRLTGVRATGASSNIAWTSPGTLRTS
jgi:glutamate/tyrosine decarboxylase-like PLP-dependent enzyme